MASRNVSMSQKSSSGLMLVNERSMSVSGRSSASSLNSFWRVLFVPRVGSRGARRQWHLVAAGSLLSRRASTSGVSRIGDGL
eukprot:6179876-Pleurochrysis_carterae.AAC.4